MPNVPNEPGVPPLASYAANSVPLLTSDAPIAAILPVPPWGIYFSAANSSNPLFSALSALGSFPVILPASVQTQAVNVNAETSPFAAVASLLGFPNLVPVFASTIDFEYSQDWVVADYPIEQGGFQSYDKVQMPFEVRVRMACGGSAITRQSFLNAIFAICGGSPLGSSSFLSTAISAIQSATGLGSLASSITGGILGGTTVPPLFDILTPEGTYSSCSAQRLSFSRTAYEGATLIIAAIDFIQVRQTSTVSFTNTAIAGVSGLQSGGQSVPQSASFPSGTPL